MPDIAVIFVNLGIVGVLVGTTAGWNRVRFARDRRSFGCRLALLGPNPSTTDQPHWSWFKTRAKWTNDLLVIQVGPLWARTLTVPARIPLTSRIQESGHRAVRRLGSHPQTLVIR